MNLDFLSDKPTKRELCVAMMRSIHSNMKHTPTEAAQLDALTFNELSDGEVDSIFKVLEFQIKRYEEVYKQLEKHLNEYNKN